MKETAYVQPLQTIYLEKKAGKRANAEPQCFGFVPDWSKV